MIYCLLAEVTTVKLDHPGDTSTIYYTLRINIKDSHIFNALAIAITMVLLAYIMPYHCFKELTFKVFSDSHSSRGLKNQSASTIC